nr:retrovirus-related Pol polyprotein from transposon TNT 1-94 [Tanacetum cinerariifolium]
MVVEYGLSSKLTQSSGGSLDTREGFENSGSFKSSGSLEEEDFEYEAYSEGGSETPQIRSKESMHLKKDINEEMSSLEKNQTWSLVSLSVKRRDYRASGCSGLKKSIMEAKVGKVTTTRLGLSIVALEDLHLEKLDFKIAFLHGDLDQVMQAQVLRNGATCFLKSKIA